MCTERRAFQRKACVGGDQLFVELEFIGMWVRRRFCHEPKIIAIARGPASAEAAAFGLYFSTGGGPSLLKKHLDRYSGDYVSYASFNRIDNRGATGWESSRPFQRRRFGAAEGGGGRDS